MTRAEQELAEAKRALTAGDFATAATHFERAAELLPASKPADIAFAWESVFRLRLIVRDADGAARALARAQKVTPGSLRLVKAAAELADLRGDTAARETAWRTVATEGDPADRLNAYLKLANLARDASFHEQALSYFTLALEASDENDPAQRAELQLEIAISHATLLKFDDAERALAQAEDLAVPEQKTFAARVEGQRGVIAFGRGNLEQALVHAEAARAGAVTHDDVMTYLAASTLIVGIHEAAGRLVEAYDTIMRAQSSLSSLLGPEGKSLVAPALQLFEERHGPDEFAEIWNDWVAMRRAEKADEASFS